MIYIKAQASRFQIIDGKLMPALSTIDGLGEKAAEAVVEAAKDGPFLSKRMISGNGPKLVRP